MSFGMTILNIWIHDDVYKFINIWHTDKYFYKFMPGTLYNTVTPVMDNLRIRTLYPEKRVLS